MGVHHGFLGLAVVGTRWGNLAMALIFGSGVAYFYRLILSVLLLCSFGSVSAYVPAVETPRWFTSGGVLLDGVDPVLAWKARIDGLYGPGKNPACGDIFLVSGVQKVNCTSTYMSDTLTNNPISACPENSSGGVTTCSCNAGFLESGGACVVDSLSVCDAMNATGVVYSRGGALGSSACMSGTTVQASMAATGAAGTSYAGKTLLYGPFSCSGAPCTNGPANTASQNAPEPCMRPKQSGTVNGVSVCLDAPSTLAPGSSSAALSPAGSASNPTSGLGAGAPPSATSSASETTCSGGSCTTKTIFSDSGGVVVGEKADTLPQSSFCNENPSSPMCAEARFSGGGCGAPDSCSGDAVLCAIQAQAKATACKLEDVFKPDDGASSVGAAALSGADGINTDAMKVAAAASPVNVGSFDSSGRGWSRTCPSDPVFEIPFGTATSWTMPISRICSPLGILANFGVGITLLASLIWVIGGRKT